MYTNEEPDHARAVGGAYVWQRPARGRAGDKTRV